MYPKEPCGNYGPGQPDLFALALTSPALFHMIICSSAIYMDVYSGRPESRESQLHKLEAIQCLSDSMKESSGISDASIGAVAYLAKIEVIFPIPFLLQFNISSSHSETTICGPSIETG